MTEEEIETAKNEKKAAIKVYINDPDPARALKALQLLVSAVVTNAGSLENLAMIQAALASTLGPGAG